MYVFPNCRTVVRWENNSRIRLNPDQQWRADDPFVLARPELFDVDPRQVSQTVDENARTSRSQSPLPQPEPEPEVIDPVDPQEPVVERVTAAPGEKRATPPRRSTSRKNAPGDNKS